MKHLLVTPLQMGRIIQTARKASQLNQSELASRIGLSQSRISAFELQPENISLWQLLSLLNALDLQLTVEKRMQPDAAGSSDITEW